MWNGSSFFYQYKKIKTVVNDKENKIRIQRNILLRWIENNIRGNTIENYLYKKGIRNVAIYGMSDLGRILIHALKNSDKINVICGLDKNADNIRGNFEIYNIEKMPKNVDAVIVALVDNLEDVHSMIKNNMKEIRIFDLEDIIFDI